MRKVGIDQGYIGDRERMDGGKKERTEGAARKN